jgi:hypothetical protein
VKFLGASLASARGFFMVIRPVLGNASAALHIEPQHMRSLYRRIKHIHTLSLTHTLAHTKIHTRGKDEVFNPPLSLSHTHTYALTQRRGVHLALTTHSLTTHSLITHAHTHTHTECPSLCSPELIGRMRTTTFTLSSFLLMMPQFTEESTLSTEVSE